MLKTLLLLPLIGAAGLSLLPSRRVDLLRHLASVIAAATMFCAGLLLLDFDPTSADIQFFETRPWNPRVGSQFRARRGRHLAADGLAGDGALFRRDLLLDRHPQRRQTVFFAAAGP
jgi:NADH:ubiquinone oxidoreductase subunit 4 (subunit M)